MTDKEVARFKVKFPSVNLSKARLDGIKLHLADDADDAAIDARLDEVNGNFPFEDIAKHDDRQRQPAKPDPAPQTKPAEQAKPDDTDADLPADTPPWAKTLIKQNKELSDKVMALETGKTVDTRRAQLDKALEGASETFKKQTLKHFERMTFKDDEDFKNYITDVTTDAGESKQSETDSAMGNFGVPAQPKTDTSKQASKEEVQSIFGKK